MVQNGKFVLAPGDEVAGDLVNIEMLCYVLRHGLADAVRLHLGLLWAQDADERYERVRDNNEKAIGAARKRWEEFRKTSLPPGAPGSNLRDSNTQFRRRQPPDAREVLWDARDKPLTRSSD
jgi:hypothetical protein